MSLLTQAKIINHRQVAQELFVLELAAPEAARRSKPGQFLQVKAGNTSDPLLRRPISLFDVEPDRGIITLLYRVVGKGTGLMTGLKVNDCLDIMGPLGRGFTLPEQPESILLVGGGVGLAPLLFLGRALQESKCQVRVLGGAASQSGLWPARRLARLGIPFWGATMDGSEGHHGLVTEILPEIMDKGAIERIYACGPEAMMAVVAEFAHQNHIWGEVSLEEHMACGVGACLGCARRLKSTDQEYAKVCKDGPVFNMEAVDFHQLQA